MEFLLFILPILFTHLFGFFDGMQTIRKDYGTKYFNRVYQYYLNRDDDYLKWYIGGNDFYPPANPFKCDFWHLMKFGWTFCISAIALSIVLVSITYPSYWLILYIFLYGVEGFSFSFYYSYILRDDRTFREYIETIIGNWKKR